jgi:hypothetical protein
MTTGARTLIDDYLFEDWGERYADPAAQDELDRQYYEEREREYWAYAISGATEGRRLRATSIGNSSWQVRRPRSTRGRLTSFVRVAFHRPPRYPPPDLPFPQIESWRSLEGIKALPSPRRMTLDAFVLPSPYYPPLQTIRAA